MGRRQTINCLHCGAGFKTRLRGSVSYLPTGKDYDWCESSENKQCPVCRKLTELRVRVWFESREIEIVSRTPYGS